MPSEVHTPPEPGLTTLVKGIVNDIGDLIKQQFQFATVELKKDLRRTGEASKLLLVGIATAFPGLVLLPLMLVHLLHWLTAPEGTDPAGLPLWACYGIVSFLFLGAGTALVLVGKSKFQAFNPLPDETAQTMKENLEWITNSK